MEHELVVGNLARDDLESEYLDLRSKYKQTLEAKEKDAQHIYDLKRSLATAKAAEQYLAQELEQLTACNKTTDETKNQHLLTECEDLRQKSKTIELEMNSLQEENFSLRTENAQLRHKLEQHNSRYEQPTDENENEKLFKRMEVLEEQNLELLQKLDEERAESVKQTLLLAEKEKRVQIVQDELMCVQENLRYKREELEEKTNLLESTQEQLFEANAKINQLMSAPENKDRKGNSLFAEVDDQRQVLIKLLRAQKKSYSEMKKVYNESQYEIRRLQRENSAMHAEIKTCSIIFRNADRTYQEKLVKRIGHLFDDNEELKKKLKRAQDNLKELAQDRGVPWLGSMLDFCKEETKKLKAQLYSIRIENSSLEEQIRNLQQEMARWRFESLKQRCLLLDRESLLTQNKIEFKPQESVEYDITAEEIANAKPRIVPIDEVKSHDHIDSTINTKNTDSKPKEEVTQFEQSLNSTSKSVISINESIDKENVSSPQKIESIACTQRSPLALKADLNESPNTKISPKKKFEQMNPSKSLPSILCKERDFMSENEKKVQFSANEPTVHILPSSLNTSTDIEVKSENKINSKKSDVGTGDSSLQTTKTVFTKSKVVVRSFVIKPRTK